jgi:hypothetical protein
MKPAVAADRKKERPRVAVAVGAPDIGHFDMPETCFPIRTRLQVPTSSPVLTLLFITMTLGGCSGGDFGRTRQDFLNDDMHRWIGGERPEASACVHRNSSSPTTSGCFAILLTR